MSLGAIRTYFNQRITSVDSNLSEWTDAFNLENVPSTLLESKYHIGLGPSSSASGIDFHIRDDFTVNVTLWKRGLNNVPNAVDELLDEANCIRTDIINPRNIEDFNQDILKISAIGIEIEEIQASNDDVVQVQIIFEVRKVTILN